MTDGHCPAEIEVSIWHANLVNLDRCWLGIRPPGGGLPGRQQQAGFAEIESTGRPHDRAWFPLPNCQNPR